MSSPVSTPSRRRGGKRGRGSNPPTRKCFWWEGAGPGAVGRRPEPARGSRRRRRGGGRRGAGGGRLPGGLSPRCPPAVPVPRSAAGGVATISTPAAGLLVSSSARCSVSSFAETSDRGLHLHRRPAAHAHLPARRPAEPQRPRCSLLQPPAVPPRRYAGARAGRAGGRIRLKNTLGANEFSSRVSHSSLA